MRHFIRTSGPRRLSATLASAVIALPLIVASVSAHADALPTFKVIANNGILQPARLEVPAGQRVKLELKNAGTSPVEFENLRLRVEKVLGPGAESFVVLNPLQPGSYDFIDEFHAATGKLVLVAK